MLRVVLKKDISFYDFDKNLIVLHVNDEIYVDLSYGIAVWNGTSFDIGIEEYSLIQ